LIKIKVNQSLFRNNQVKIKNELKKIKAEGCPYSKTKITKVNINCKKKKINEIIKVTQNEVKKIIK
jgi:hypothetical protein